ncbi:hypothetical protein BGW37DRAFT_517317 [Umbelopsis sp. PMI_123]|nr:hypothetical protein BGW37DRAFT_517317 [Umbelopsis sp. PMI_123]
MYVIPDNSIKVQPLARPVERAISHRDYMLLQQLLQTEKKAREEKLREQLKQQYALQEYKKLELALYRLAYWQALARQRREEQIQRAVQAYRQKQLIRAVEEQVYRRKIAEALEQRQNEMLRNRYLQNARAQLAQRQDKSPRLVAYPRLDSSFDDYKAKHMCNLLRHCFADNESQQEPVEDDGNPEWIDEDDDDYDEQDLQQSLWNRLNMVDEPEEFEDDQTKEGTQNAYGLPDVLQTVSKASPQASPARHFFQPEEKPKPEEKPEPEAEAEQEPTGDDEEPAIYEKQKAKEEPTYELTPTAADGQSYVPNDRLIEEQTFNQEQTLQDFLRQLMELRAEDDYDEVLPSTQKEPKQQQQQQYLEPSVNTNKFGGYIPEDIITEAEPTPVNDIDESDITLMPKTPDMVPAQVVIPPELPVEEPQEGERVVDEKAKQVQLDKLATIEQNLDQIKNRHANEAIGPLTFDTTTKRKTLPATTKPNKEFLRREEELIQLLLQLDAIDSMGRDDIRKRRKHAVAEAEKLLEALDDYKSTST